MRLTRVMGKDLDPVALSRSILLSKKGGTGKTGAASWSSTGRLRKTNLKGNLGLEKARILGCCLEHQLDGAMNDFTSSDLTT